MDPITLIVTALATGAALGLQDTASAMVKDAYASLKALVKRRLGGDPGAEMVLARHEQAPETWQASLREELARTGAEADTDLVAAAKALLDLVGEAGKYTVDVRGAQGVQIGITTGRTTCSTPQRTVPVRGELGSTARIRGRFPVRI